MQRLPSLPNDDSNTPGMMVGADANMLDMSNPASAAEKAAVAKARKMPEEAVRLATADVGKARGLYRAALMTGAGLNDEAEAQSSAGEEKRDEEQRRCSDLRIQPGLKWNPLQLAVPAKTVHFRAATVMKGGKQVFVNRACEGRDELWKLLFRLGPGRTKAAIQVAEQCAAGL